MVHKRELRKALNNYLKVSVSIKERDIARDIMDKKLFIESIILLREIEDRRDFMEEEIGMDMSMYEEKFLQIIENLFKLHFNNEQFALIQYYLYKVPTIDNWDGMIDLSDAKEVVTVKFETPDEVWTVINSLKKLQNPYGDGNSAYKIIKVLKEINLLETTQKRNSY